MASEITSALIYGGVNVKHVQLAMGHVIPTVTLNTYLEYWPDAVVPTRSLVDDALLYRICTGWVPGRGQAGGTAE
ncbi:hypothetical protein GCM10012275_36660 [Longimycelium tulufanense]|uniref:Integrase n=1 Tax=Longimycelium tulufanense TaxID=907463 RepID=A0A8J3CG54_9PSEU|nr:hypothetical protein [Longimycelium tulufanense]GGM62612.1 hypothetical protein GCM10012275_36660 [Longimycelium tulufanense]